MTTALRRRRGVNTCLSRDKSIYKTPPGFGEFVFLQRPHLVELGALHLLRMRPVPFRSSTSPDMRTASPLSGIRLRPRPRGWRSISKSPERLVYRFPDG
jgi:hypothetical protein